MLHPIRLTRLTTILLAMACVGTARPAVAKTFVIPHIVESSGKITNTQYTFDTQMFMTYTPGLVGGSTTGSATADLFLYDNTGQLMRSLNGQNVCAPCSYVMGDDGSGTVTRKRTIVMDDLIQDAGGFATNVVLGFGVLVVGGQDPDAVKLQGFVVNAHTNPFDLSVFGFEPQPIAAAGAVKTFVLPHMLEKSGRISNTQYTFDTQVFATYTAGLAGSPPGTGATLDFYLFDESGSPMMGASSEVCNPCTIQLSDVSRKRAIDLEQLIVANGGGFPPGQDELSGFGVLVVSGHTEDVSLQGFVVNSHTSPFDLAVFGFSPQEIAASKALDVIVGDQPGAALALRASPNPARGEISFAYELGVESEVSLEIFDAAGRRVSQVVSERRPAGPGSARWLPVDEAGKRLPSGVYYAKMAAADGSRISRVVFLPN